MFLEDASLFGEAPFMGAFYGRMFFGEHIFLGECAFCIAHFGRASDLFCRESLSGDRVLRRRTPPFRALWGEPRRDTFGTLAPPFNERL